MFWTVFTFELAYWFKRPLTLLFFVLFFLMAFFSTASDAFLGIAGGSDPSQRAVRARDGDGNSHGDRSGDHDGDRRHRGVARRAARHRGDAVHDATQRRAGYLLGRFCRRVRHHARDLRRAADRTARRHAHAVGAGRQARARSRSWARSSRSSSIALPNLLFVSALLFAVGALTRKLFAVYITGIVLLVAWQVTQQIVGQLDKLTLASLIDPFALTTTNAMIRYWSVAEKNTRLVPFAGRCCRTGCCGSRSRSRCSRSCMVLFRLRLQHGGRARRKAKRAEARRSRRRAANARRRAALRHASLASRVVRAEPLSISARSSAKRRFSRSRPSASSTCMVGAWYTSHPGDSAIWPVTSAIAPIIGEQRVHLHRPARDALRR